MSKKKEGERGGSWEGKERGRKEEKREERENMPSFSSGEIPGINLEDNLNCNWSEKEC